MDILLIPIAYLIGSISFAVVVSKCMRLPDPHSYGSGNPGATNVLRTGNKLAAVLTLLGDALKGFLAVVLARMILGDDSLRSSLNSWILCGVVVAVFLGHLFPVFHASSFPELHRGAVMRRPDTRSLAGCCSLRRWDGRRQTAR